MEQMQKENGESNADAADGVEEEETADDFRLKRPGRSECPKFVPDEVVGQRHESRADFAEGDVPSQTTRIGQEVENAHIHHHAAATDETEFDELQEARSEMRIADCRMGDFFASWSALTPSLSPKRGGTWRGEGAIGSLTHTRAIRIALSSASNFRFILL